MMPDDGRCLYCGKESASGMMLTPTALVEWMASRVEETRATVRVCDLVCAFHLGLLVATNP